MKRLFLAAAISCALLSSCASGGVIGAAEPELDKPFSAQAEITFGSETCKAQLRRFSEENWELCATEPFALEGLIVTRKDGETKLSMYGLEGFADFSDNAVSAARLITGALDAASEGTVARNGNETTVSGDSENAHFTITLDEAGNPMYLNLSGRGIAVKLSDFTELPIDEQVEPAGWYEQEQPPQGAGEDDIVTVE